MLSRYQHGMMALFEKQLVTDLSKSFADKVIGDNNEYRPILTGSEQGAPSTSSVLSLWQALHLQQLLPVLSTVLKDKQLAKQSPWQQVLREGLEQLLAQLDPSGQVFDGLDVAKQLMLILLAYRLSKDIKGQMISAQQSSLLSYNDASVIHYIVDLRRHARLIDTDLAAISDANLQWLLLTAQSLNSIQLLALIETLPSFISSDKDTKYDDHSRERQQDCRQIDYNTGVHGDPSYTYSDYRRWLSTLHTVMLHDTIISQDEYDCLILLSDHWLGVRQLF